MGRGDKKSRKGKIAKGSYGVTRPKKSNKTVAVKKTTEKAPAAAPAAKAAKKTARKKADA